MHAAVGTARRLCRGQRLHHDGLVGFNGAITVAVSAEHADATEKIDVTSAIEKPRQLEAKRKDVRLPRRRRRRMTTTSRNSPRRACCGPRPCDGYFDQLAVLPGAGERRYAAALGLRILAALLSSPDVGRSAT